MSIYSNLFRYSPRPSRRPIEDFLSEALADLLNRVPREVAVDFVAEILLDKGRVRAEWQKLMRKAPTAELKWLTQLGVKFGQRSGIVDLVLQVGGREALVIENKIGAPVRTHNSDSTDDDSNQGNAKVPTANANQLRTYGEWLRERRSGEEWAGALVLLTHFTRPPSDFDDPGAYGVTAIVRRWRSVWSWASEFGGSVSKSSAGKAATDLIQPELWRVLCREFADFLEEEEMSSEYLTFHDMAAIELFVGSQTRVENTFERVKEVLEPFRKTLGPPLPKIYGPYYNSEVGAVWSYVYFRDPPIINNNWHIAWGIRFPSAGSDWWASVEPPLRGAPHVFVTALAEGEPYLPIGQILKKIPKGWSINEKENEIIILRDLHGPRHDPESWATDFADWVTSKASEIYPLLKEMAKTLKS